MGVGQLVLRWREKSALCGHWQSLEHERILSGRNRGQFQLSHKRLAPGKRELNIIWVEADGFKSYIF